MTSEPCSLILFPYHWGHGGLAGAQHMVRVLFVESDEAVLPKKREAGLEETEAAAMGLT